MTDYSSQIDQIRQAKSLEEIREIARQFSAKATGEGGVLYSRPVGNVSSERIALELAEKTGLPIINKTPRAEFLSDGNVRLAITDSAEKIFQTQGHTAEAAEKLAASFQYGDPKAAVNSLTSLDGCLWGDASREFAASMRGDIKVVATAANMDRVFGKVELPTILNNPDVKTLGGQPVAHLRDIAAKDGVQSLLNPVQSQFVEAAPRGIYKAPGMLSNKEAPVTLSKEFAGAMGVDASKFTPASNLSASGTVVRADIGMAAQVARDEAAVAARTAAKVLPGASGLVAPKGTGAVATGESTLAAEAGRGLRPGTVAKGAGVVVAAAGVTYDVTTTYRDASRLYGQGNSFGAESKIVGTVSRNVGVFGGMALGTAAGAAVTSETGPGAIIGGAIGGIAGAIGGDKFAQWIDQHRINNQSDKQGNTWTFDPKHPDQGWTRRELDLDAMRYSQGVPVYKPQALHADPAVADELNYKASNRATELALSAPPKARDPYTLPSEQDKPGWHASNWTRDAQNGTWSRVLTDAAPLSEFQLIPKMEREQATPAQAAEFERQSQAITAKNAAQTPAAIATHYQTAYDQYGWSRHGKVPEAVTDAIRHPGRLVASDGDAYERGADGQWISRGMIWDSKAEGAIKQELDATYRQQQKTLNPAHASVDVRPDTPAAQPRSPADPDHPDHTMLGQIRTGVRKIDEGLGKPYDEMSERVSRSLLAACKDNREAYPDAADKSLSSYALNRVDHVIMGKNGNVFAVEGQPESESHKRAFVSAEEAVRTPVEQSDAKLLAANQVLSQERELAQRQELTRNQDDPSKSGPKMSA